MIALSRQAKEGAEALAKSFKLMVVLGENEETSSMHKVHITFRAGSHMHQLILG